MSFKSLAFVFFFSIVWGVHYRLKPTHRWSWLLLASYFFYMWGQPVYALLLLCTTSLSFGAALAISKSHSPYKRRCWLWLSLFGCLGTLFFFKYGNFALSSWHTWVGGPQWILEVTLPVGISFFTFQALSYTVDVYRGDLPAVRHFGRYALYIAFFPQLVAGPIERASRILPQLATPRNFDYVRVVSGLRVMLGGFVLKVLLADRLALLVEPVYRSPATFNSPDLILATVFFAFQIYCDFAGYSWIAIGAARTLGIELSINFRSPYLATSVADFWHRWHITLSTWFRDYLYIPLGGNRVSRSRLYANLLIVFVLSGLWHGAKWTFVVWGALHGLFMLVSHLTREPRKVIATALGLPKMPKLWHVWQIATTFSLICIGWIFFRAADLDTASYILLQLFDDWSLTAWYTAFARLDTFSLVLVSTCLTTMLMLERLSEQQPLEQRIAAWPTPMRWALYLATLCVLFFWGTFAQQPFLYFQF